MQNAHQTASGRSTKSRTPKAEEASSRHNLSRLPGWWTQNSSRRWEALHSPSRLAFHDITRVERSAICIHKPGMDWENPLISPWRYSCVSGVGDGGRRGGGGPSVVVAPAEEQPDRQWAVLTSAGKVGLAPGNTIAKAISNWRNQVDEPKDDIVAVIRLS